MANLDNLLTHPAHCNDTSNNHTKAISLENLSYEREGKIVTRHPWLAKPRRPPHPWVSHSRAADRVRLARSDSTRRCDKVGGTSGKHTIGNSQSEDYGSDLKLKQSTSENICRISATRMNCGLKKTLSGEKQPLKPEQGARKTSV